MIHANSQEIDEKQKLIANKSLFYTKTMMMTKYNIKAVWQNILIFLQNKNKRTSKYGGIKIQIRQLASSKNLNLYFDLHTQSCTDRQTDKQPD